MSVKKISEVLSADKNKIKVELSTYGLSSDESKVYLELISNTPRSILHVSQKTGINRTKLYKICDKLSVLGLITKHGSHYKTRYIANEPEQIETIVNRKRLELTQMEKSLPSLITNLKNIKNPPPNATIVRYEGIDGLKQVSWNSTKAKGVLRIFELATMDTFLDFDFAERVRIEFVRQGLTETRQITNQKSIKQWTNISDFVDIWHCRYVNPKELKFHMEVMIYNNVVAMYQYHKKRVFCVEIYNDDLAKTQSSFYDFVWNRADPLLITDERGSAILPKKDK